MMSVTTPIHDGVDVKYFVGDAIVVDPVVSVDASAGGDESRGIDGNTIPCGEEFTFVSDLDTAVDAG